MNLVRFEAPEWLLLLLEGVFSFWSSCPDVEADAAVLVVLLLVPFRGVPAFAALPGK